MWNKRIQKDYRRSSYWGKFLKISDLKIHIYIPQVNEYPWIALLYIVKNYKTYICSGSLIASAWMTTAGHCVVYSGTMNKIAESAITVVLGEHDTATLTESTIPRKELRVLNIILHEGYSFPLNDIALLKLSEAVDIDVYTPICLPNTGDYFISKIASVYGQITRP